MPAFLGDVKIWNVAGTATVIFGDAAAISPMNVSKTTHGSGSGSNGAFMMNNNYFSMNTTGTISMADQPYVVR
ncbi:spore germination protein [Weizmannia acidilactici]|uniref:spore germination protein n=1 Tax=Weizmannia acidilactici TaxID=2607726 RepID=UPI00124F1621|nr:spore germination protein [Weizmannia acidilactici]